MGVKLEAWMLDRWHLARKHRPRLTNQTLNYRGLDKVAPYQKRSFNAIEFGRDSCPPESLPGSHQRDQVVVRSRWGQVNLAEYPLPGFSPVIERAQFGRVDQSLRFAAF
ncbi:MAG: hypothetical protein JWN34_1380 [Bryobacterales bacterium]|nr:hypothetical protein [Bryobacterales bacterium]